MPSPSGPFPAVLCPSIGRPGGAGVRRLGCCGWAIVCPSSALLMFHCSHANAFFPPHLHPRGCCREYLLGLGCQGCSGACSTPFSRLLQPSVRSVVDLGVLTFGHHPLPSPSLCGRVTLSVGVHSVCAPVSTSGGLAGLLRSPGSVHSSDGSSCFSSFLRFLLHDTVYQFQALYFGLSTAPRVFTWVMAPVSAIFHSLGIRMRRYLDTWLVQSSSHESLLEVLLPVLRLCPVFGMVIHPRYSNLIPSQVVQYLWVVFDSTSFRASPSVERISRLQSTAAVFLSCA